MSSEPTTDRSGWQGLPEWQGPMGKRWAAAASTADDQFAPLTDASIVTLMPLPGQRLLDVGCGSGGTTAALAALVRPDGHVTGVDPSADNLAIAARITKGLPVTLIEGDAQVHPFATGEFDGVFSRLGVMFFEDPTAAFANLRRATKTGGRLVFTCWPPREQSEVMIVPARALLGVIDMAPPAPPGAPSPFSLGDVDVTRSILERAGWGDVTFSEVTVEISFPDDLAAAARQLASTLPASLLLQGVDEATMAKARVALEGAVPESRRQSTVLHLVTATA